jgi:DNA-binding LytR/AlgR family response regulator
MEKLKVAILEDEEFLLKDLKMNLEETGLVDIVFYALSAKDFNQKMEIHKPEALLLDIDLRGESVTGLDIAGRYKLPVLFISGKTNQFNTELEDLDTNFDFTVMRLRKPVAQDALVRTLKKFIKEIRSFEKASIVYLDLLNVGRVAIKIDSIVYITSKGETSNNKVIYFTDRNPEILIDFTADRMDEFGLDPEQFIEIHRSYWVNKNKIEELLRDYTVRVTAQNTKGNLEKILLKVSEGRQSRVKKLLK